MEFLPWHQSKVPKFQNQLFRNRRWHYDFGYRSRRANCFYNYPRTFNFANFHHENLDFKQLSPPSFQCPPVWSELRSNHQLCDGTVRCSRNQIFPVHRIIVSSVSPFFKAFFTNVLNPRDPEIRELALPDVPGELFSSILDFAYTGCCQVTSNNAENLLALADRLEVLGVIELCCQFLTKELGPQNCLGIWKFAKIYSCHELVKASKRYILKNFEKVLFESPEFRNLEMNDLEILLSDDELNALREELVLEAIKLWVEASPYKRKVHVLKLLNCVRLGLVGFEYLNHYPFTKELAQNSFCAWANHKFAKPRVPQEVIFAMSGWSSGSPTNFVETFDARANRWFLLSYTDNSPRAYHGTCVLDNLIYVVGGYDGRRYLNTVCCFNPVTKEWREKSCMHTPRCYVSVCCYDGKIYALGGNDGRMRLSSCERYDPKTNQWEFIASMRWKRSDASAAELDGKIYIVGGYDGRQNLNSMEVYDVEKGKWNYSVPLRVSRSGVSLVALGNYLYAIGGYDGRARLRSGEKLDPVHDVDWQKIADMMSPRSNFASVVMDNMIFAIGGYSKFSTTMYVEFYLSQYDRWYSASPMNLSRSGLSACVISNLENVRDYTYHKLHQSPWPKPGYELDVSYGNR